MVYEKKCVICGGLFLCDQPFQVVHVKAGHRIKLGEQA